MTEKDFTPSGRFIIEDLETLRVLADPLRSQIYEIFLNRPASVRQVAEQLGLAPSRLYYHVNMLEKFNLLRVVETRMVANIQEKFYRAVAYELEVAHGLLDFKTEEGKITAAEMIRNTLDTTREDLLRSLEARSYVLERGAQEKPRSVIVTRHTATIPDELAQEFHERLEALLSEFGTSDQGPGGDPPRQTYALAIAYYPSFYYPID
jgi:AcrR family transcriptional regulator